MTNNKIVSILLVSLLIAISSGCGTGDISTRTSSTVSDPGSGTGGGTGNNPDPGTGTPSTATGSATLAWTAPTTNTDGTPLTNLAGYKIYYGTSSRSYTTIINAGNLTSYTINNLSSGTHYFAVTTYDTQQVESGYSSEVTKTVQ